MNNFKVGDAVTAVMSPDIGLLTVTKVERYVGSHASWYEIRANSIDNHRAWVEGHEQHFTRAT